jgi:hypothetical protein
LRPGKRCRRGTLGISGSTSSHNSSDTIHGAAATGTPSMLTTDADGVRRQGTGPSFMKGALRNQLYAHTDVTVRRYIVEKFDSLWASRLT